MNNLKEQCLIATTNMLRGCPAALEKHAKYSEKAEISKIASVMRT